jgi:glutamate synthase (NADPH/NADH) large chain
VGDLLERHLAETGSEVAGRLLESGASAMGGMRKVMPLDYQRVLDATREALESGRAVDEAVMAAAHG